MSWTSERRFLNLRRSTGKLELAWYKERRIPTQTPPNASTVCSTRAICPKLLHPPTVVRSSWVEDSAHAGRKLPVAEYMVEGVFVQKRTLAASFAATAAPRSPSEPRRGKDEPSTIGRSQRQPLGREGMMPRDVPAAHKHSERSMSLSTAVSGPLADRNGAREGAFRGGDSKGGQELMARKATSALGAPARGEDGARAEPSARKPATSATKRPTTATLSGVDPAVAGGDDSRIDRLREDLEADAGEERGSTDRAPPKAESVGDLPPFELHDMDAAGEGGRTTKDDPAFMKTFFQNSRLHYIGVG